MEPRDWRVVSWELWSLSRARGASRYHFGYIGDVVGAQLNRFARETMCEEKLCACDYSSIEDGEQAALKE
jgi:hypothetical protein